MSRKATVEGLARALRYLDRAFWRYDHKPIAEALKKAGIDAGMASLVGQFLVDIWELKLLPEKPERNCAECGDVTGSGPLDTTFPRSNAVYCSNKCRQKAYRKRKTARYGKKDCAKRPTVTKGKSVTGMPLEKAAQP